jgi:enamine deaminase RidA (YjgF/YER057c/UK114 family)
MNSVVTLIRAPRLLAPAPYAYAATAPAGSHLIFLAGACPLDTDGVTVSPGDIRAQTVKAFDNLIVALEAAGAKKTDLLSTRVLVASSERAHLDEAWQVVSDAMGNNDVPSTLLGVTVLGYPNQLVEIEAVAAVAV